MFIHSISAPLKEGKKVRRNAWPTGDYVAAGSNLEDDGFELSDDECKNIGVKPGTVAKVFSNALVYVSKDLGVNIGYEVTAEDRNSADWDIVD